MNLTFCRKPLKRLIKEFGKPVRSVYCTFCSDHTSGSKWSYMTHISYEWPLNTCLCHILISNSCLILIFVNKIPHIENIVFTVESKFTSLGACSDDSNLSALTQHSGSIANACWLTHILHIFSKFIAFISRIRIENKVFTIKSKFTSLGA